MQHVRHVFLVIFCVALLACRATPTPPHPPVKLRIGGADSTQLLARDLADAYHQAHAYASVEVSITNSATGLRELAQGSLDLAWVSRNPRADELTHPRARAVEIARDGIAIIVHPSNPVKNVSREQLAEIFSGEVLNWSQLSSTVTVTTTVAAAQTDAIQVVSREQGSGTRAEFEQQVMQGRRVTLTALIQSTSRDVRGYVAANPNAIGYISFNLLKNNAQIRALAINNIEPTLDTIQASRYPLMQTYYLIVPHETSPDVSDFVDFVLSASARSLILSRMAPSR